MSTQHPDNVRQPFFADNSILGGDDEIKEAFYAFSHLKIKEQLWDCEGKEVDNFVVEKLLTKYEDYFRKHKIGRDVFITLRGPNPRVEKNKGKLLLETLESIPRNSDIAKQFYNEDSAPIFEVTIPMVGSSEEILRVKNYYDEFIIGKKSKKVNDISIKEWVGDFKPDTINVIPLIEDKDSMLKAAEITGGYLNKVSTEYQRVWLARSDPALNYGNLSAILLNKVALQNLYDLGEKKSVDIYPIIGCGSAPFRGNFRPDNTKNMMEAYPSVQTFT
ncbi:MAG: phosphoenolpyruvate carboxylase, partial [Nanoarchaeota archaeon]